MHLFSWETGVLFPRTLMQIYGKHIPECIWYAPPLLFPPVVPRMESLVIYCFSFLFPAAFSYVLIVTCVIMLWPELEKTDLALGKKRRRLRALLENNMFLLKALSHKASLVNIFKDYGVLLTCFSEIVWSIFLLVSVPASLSPSPHYARVFTLTTATLHCSSINVCVVSQWTNSYFWG